MPDFDARQVVLLAARIAAGLSAVFAPTVQKLVEKAIVTRIDLRGAAVPRRYELVKSELMALNPFHVEPCGDTFDIQEVLRKIPKPVEVKLPPGVLKRLTDRPSRGSKSGRSGRGYSFRGRAGSGSSFGSNQEARSSSGADRLPSRDRRGGNSKRPFRGKYDRQRGERKSAQASK